MWRDSDYPGLTLAGPDALGPCMIRVRVVGISTLLEPSTTASATTDFTGLLHDTALAANETESVWTRDDNGGCRVAFAYWCLDTCQ